MSLRTAATHLMIYGDEDPHIRRLAARFVAEDRARHVAEAAHAYTDLRRILNRYVNLEQITFYTHGNSGYVHLQGGGLSLGSVWVLIPPHSNLFESSGRLLFAGCNVGQGENGIEFLIEAGRNLFRRRGGVVGAANSLNYFGRWGLLDIKMPIWGTLKLVQLDSEGTVVANERMRGGISFRRGARSHVE